MAILSRGGLFIEMQEARKMRPKHVLVLSIDGQAHGKAIASYYMKARGIPMTNDLRLPLTWVKTDGRVLDDVQLAVLMSALTDKLSELRNIKCLVLCGNWPDMPSAAVRAIESINLIGIMCRPYKWMVDGTIFTRTALGLSIPPLHLIPAMLADEYSESGVSHITHTPKVLPIGSDSNYTSITIKTGRKNVPVWQPLERVTAGEIRRLTGSDANFLNAIYTVGGVTGATEPTTESGSSLADGSAIYAHRNASRMRNFPADYRHPEDQLDRLSDAGDWHKSQFSVAITILDAPEPAAGDAVNDSAFGIVKRMIDDAIAVEQIGRSNLEGAIALAGTTTNASLSYYIAGSAPYLELLGHGYDMSSVYHHELDADQAAYNVLQTPIPILPTVDNFYSTNTANHPVDGNSWNVIPALFLYVLGTQAYYSATSRPHLAADMDYAQGAIAEFGQSYGADPIPWRGIDSENSLQILNVQAEISTYNTRASFYYVGNDGSSILAGRLEYTPPASESSATLEVTGAGTLILRVDGGTVAAVVLGEDSPQAHRNAILTALGSLPDWEYTVSGWCESRVARSLMQGVAVAIGSNQEPLVHDGSHATNLVTVLQRGGCIGEWFISAAHMKARRSGDGNYIPPHIYGDPLYRPVNAE